MALIVDQRQGCLAPSTHTSNHKIHWSLKFEECLVGLQEVQDLQEHLERIIQNDDAGSSTSVALTLSSCEIELHHAFSALLDLLPKFGRCIHRLDILDSTNLTLGQLATLLGAAGPFCCHLSVSTRNPLAFPIHNIPYENVFAPLLLTIDNSQSNEKLQSLSWQGLDGHAVAPLARLLPSFTKLKYLSLSTYNMTTDDFCVLVKEGIVPCKSLETLELSEERFGSLVRSEAVASFGQLLFGTNLVRLSLSGFYSLFLARDSSQSLNALLLQNKTVNKTDNNITLKHFSLQDVTEMSSGDARQLFALLLQQFAALRTLKWNTCPSPTTSFQEMAELTRLVLDNTTLTELSCSGGIRHLDTKKCPMLQQWAKRNRSWSMAQSFLKHQQTANEIGDRCCCWAQVIAECDANAIHHQLLPFLLYSQNHKLVCNPRNVAIHFST